MISPIVNTKNGNPLPRRHVVKTNTSNPRAHAREMRNISQLRFGRDTPPLGDSTGSVRIAAGKKHRDLMRGDGLD